MSEMWQTRFENEMADAERSRAAGKEGRARVCARRAAGAVVMEYFTRQGYTLQTPNAYDLLHYLIEFPQASTAVRQVAEHLVQRLNTDHKLPVEADLIAETYWLKKELLG